MTDLIKKAVEEGILTDESDEIIRVRPITKEYGGKTLVYLQDADHADRLCPMWCHLHAKNPRDSAWWLAASEAGERREALGILGSMEEALEWKGRHPEKQFYVEEWCGGLVDQRFKGRLEWAEEAYSWMREDARARAARSGKPASVRNELGRTTLAESRFEPDGGGGAKEAETRI